MSFRLSDIEYRIENKKILEKKNFDLFDGDHALIFGPSGSGKTTLINLMAGLLKPTKGKIYFRNIDYSLLNELEIDNLRKEKFGFIFQKLHLIEHLNVEQNIALGQNMLNPQDVSKLIDLLGLSEKKRIIFVCVARHIGLALAKSAISVNKKVAFAFGCETASDIRLHYYAAKDYKNNCSNPPPASQAKPAPVVVAPKTHVDNKIKSTLETQNSTVNPLDSNSSVAKNEPAEVQREASVIVENVENVENVEKNKNKNYSRLNNIESFL